MYHKKLKSSRIFLDMPQQSVPKLLKGRYGLACTKIAYAKEYGCYIVPWRDATSR